MDLVTVTCSIDVEPMIRQAKSINKFVQGQITHWVIIQDTILSISEWSKHLSHLYTYHNLKLISNDFKIIKNTGGWIQQQILKLGIADKIFADEYLILDSKNFFIKETNLDTWPIQEGNGIIFSTLDFDYYKSIINDYYKWLPWITQLSVILKKPIPAVLPNPITPFRVKTSIVKKILQDLDIVTFFQTNRRDPSEFLLYGFYADNLIREPILPFKTYWKKCFITAQELELIHYDQNMKILGIHRECRDTNSITLVNSYCNFIDL